MGARVLGAVPRIGEDATCVTRILQVNDADVRRWSPRSKVKKMEVMGRNYGNMKQGGPSVDGQAQKEIMMSFRSMHSRVTRTT